jgi:Ca-activated chloride channel family protein
MLWSPSARDLEVNVPLRMIRPSWLLLLHLLIAAALTIAIGRPAVNLRTAGATRTVIILDRSASMNATDGADAASGDGADRSTRLDAAKRDARTIVSAASRTSGASIALIALAAEPKLLSGLTTDHALVVRALGAMSPTDQPIEAAGPVHAFEGGPSTPLDAALDLAEAMLAEDSDDATPPARVVIISDGDLPPIRERTIAGASIQFIRVGPDPSLEAATAGQVGPDPTRSTGHDNVGIVALAARRLEGADARVRLFARVLNASVRERSIIAVALADNVEVARRPMTIPSRRDGALTIDVLRPPGEPGPFLLTVRLETEDLLAADNQASVLVPESRTTRILIVTPSGDPERDGDWPLTDVLRELPRVNLRAISDEAWRSMSSLEPGTDLFADLIVLCGVDPAWATLRPPTQPILQIGGPRPSPDRSVPASPIIAWERGHPLMRHVSLDGVVVEAAPIADPVGTDQSVIAWTDAGAAIIAAERDGVRHIRTTFTVDQTTWPLTFGWPLFLDNAIAWITRRDERDAGHVRRTADSVSTPWPLASTSATLLSPEGTALRRGIAPSGGMLRLGPTDRAGVYALVPDDGTAGVGVIGNDAPHALLPFALLDPGESSLVTSDRISIGATPIQATSAAELPREIWHWFVLLAAALLTGEWFLFAARARV